MNSLEKIREFYSKELQLAVLLCKSASNSYDEKEIIQLIESNIDWDSFIKLSKWHRITPHIVEHLKNTDYALPEKIVSFFKNQQRENAINALKIGNQLVQITALFNKNEIEVKSIKGSVLAQELYNDINRRTYRDIDLLVPLSKIDYAHQLLVDNNYERIEPDFELSKRQKRYNYKRTHEYAYRHKENGVQVELHWRLFTNKNLLSDKIFFNDNVKDIIVFSEKIRTLSVEDNLLYLSCHGAQHLWFRLFWIKDFSVLVSTKEIDWVKAVKRFKSIGMISVLVQAVFLSNILFNTEIPKEVLKYFNSLSLLKMPLKAIGSSFKFAHNIGMSKFSILLYRLKLKKGLRYKISVFSPFATHYADWRILNLPDWLFFMYFPLRPFLWVYRILFGR